MALSCGVDLIEIERVQCSIQRYGERFLRRIFTPLEIEVCAGNPASLAARFAAKEAVAKALGCGIGAVSWQEIEIGRGAEHQPLLQLHGEAARLAEAKGLSCWSVSLSHTQSHAIALAVASNG